MINSYYNNIEDIVWVLEDAMKKCMASKINVVDHLVWPSSKTSRIFLHKELLCKYQQGIRQEFIIFGKLMPKQYRDNSVNEIVLDKFQSPKRLYY